MPDTRCPLCTSNPITTANEQAMQACQTCASRIGLIPMPPSRRPPSPCARCNSRQFVRVIPREHTSSDTAPMHVTYAPTSHIGAVLKYVQDLEVATSGHGRLEMYICRKCGAVEWYCVDVERIPLHPHLMTEAVDYDGDTPYR
jgi:hypothetical protein